MIPQILLTPAEDFFAEFMFGSGAPFAFILISTLCFLLILRVKESAIIILPFCFVMALYLTQNVAQGSLMWYICMLYYILAFGLSLLTAYLIKDSF